MTPNIFLFSFYISLVFGATLFYLIRKQKLKEQYALLWLMLSVLMMILSLFPSILDDLARLIHIDYAPSLLYLLSVIGILFILLHLTMAVSAMTQRNVTLVQTVALQERKIQELIKQQERIEQKVWIENQVLLKMMRSEEQQVDEGNPAPPCVEVST